MDEYHILLRHCAELIEEYKDAGIKDVPIDSLKRRMDELQPEIEAFKKRELEAIGG